ncbi:MAG: hypothetical protein LBL41_03505 [Bifidobacteriaceae bacterium]|nr:hypothetical protein [Bifidobacteriaceae bacterium]
MFDVSAIIQTVIVSAILCVLALTCVYKMVVIIKPTRRAQVERRKIK